MRSYYSYRDTIGYNACSVASKDAPLTVNCAGELHTTFPFTTHNTQGRADYYLLIPLSGTLFVSLPSGDLAAQAGSVVLFAPQYPYQYRYLGEEPLAYLWIHFTGSYAAQLLNELSLSPLPLLRTVSGIEHIAEHFRHLLDKAPTGYPFQKQELACELERLLVRIAQGSTTSLSAVPFAKSIRYLHTAYNQSIRIPELAAMENLSNSRYVELFRRYFGKSPTAYLMELRMKNACELLQTTDMSVKQIAVLCGYDDPHFFSRLFKRHIGVSPQDYRQGKHATTSIL